MNRDCPQIISDEVLYKKVFKYDTSIGDNRYFRQRIVDFISSPQKETFSQFMFEAIWKRNEHGLTLKYCYYDENAQKVRIDNYFFEWMKRTIRQAENELMMLRGIQNNGASPMPINQGTKSS